MKDIPELSGQKNLCCGCGFCEAICPVNAIHMMPDEEGFLYPQIDDATCIRCSRCITKCIYREDYKKKSKINSVANCEIDQYPELKKVYAARSKDHSRVQISSSGGIFTPLSDYIIALGGAIVCSAYNYNCHEMEFRLITTVDERDNALGSKYIQSKTANIYKAVLKWVTENPNKPVLFVGTGCQGAAFRQFVKDVKIEDYSYIVDLICQGVSSPGVWKSFINMIESRYNGRVEYLTFKDKRYSWTSPLSFIRIGKKNIMIPGVVKMINSKRAFRPTCYECPYSTIKRCTDITIGDFWGIETTIPEFYYQYGTSVILVHTEKGNEIVNRILPHLECRECTIQECISNNVQPSLLHPVERPKDREEFWLTYYNKGIKEVMKKYGRLSTYSSLKVYAKRIIGTIKEIRSSL